MWIICFFSYYVIYINYVIVWIYDDPTMEMTHGDYPISPNLGMKILIGLGGLCKTFNSISLHVIP